MSDPTNPDHYKNDSSGFECIELSEHLHSGLLQQAFQYVWRAGAKGDASEDLSKALWFVGREHKFRRTHRRLVLDRLDIAEEMFLEWRTRVNSDLRAATLATIWRLDGDDDVDLFEFYGLAEMIEAMRSGLR